MSVKLFLLSVSLLIVVASCAFPYPKHTLETPIAGEFAAVQAVAAVVTANVQWSKTNGQHLKQFHTK
jgi:hypothetical protein